MKKETLTANPKPRGRLGRLAKILQDKTNAATAGRVMEGYGEFEAANPKGKAAWIRRMIGRLEDNCAAETCRSVMEACGRKCCGLSTRRLARQIWEDSVSMEDFLARMNKSGLGGGRLKLTGPNTVSGGYDRCYCGQVSQTEIPFPGKTYCQCSAGWYQQLFEAATGMKAEVELESSIISGADRCDFTIRLYR
jgi:hypothetical protein